MSDTEFVMREVDLWGEAYVLSLYDRGYVPTLVQDTRTGSQKWTWQVPQTPGRTHVRVRNLTKVGS